MIKQATRNDKKIVVDILCNSFKDNKSVTAITGEGRRGAVKLRRLINYSYQVVEDAGLIYLDKENNSCALVIFPDKKKTSLKTILADLKLVIGCVGLNVFKILKKESLISKIHPERPLYYLWYIGVQPSEQNKGAGTRLLQKLIEESLKMNRTFCLETSTVRNISWYKKNGLQIYHKADIGYPLIFFEKPLSYDFNA